MLEYITTHPLDTLGTILGFIYLILEFRTSVWMWVVGCIMPAIYVVVLYKAGIYADCGMEVYYLTMTVYGFWRWIGKPAATGQAGNTLTTDNGTTSNRSAAAITHMPRRVAIAWTLLALTLWLAIYLLLVNFTDSRVPVADAFTTALSLIGIWALARKYLEQWFVWIAVDIVTSVLYFYKDIPFKASLYALYVVIAIFGYRKWRRMMTAASS